MPRMALHSTFFLKANIPDDFDYFFKNGTPIHRVQRKDFHNKPQEWEVYSLYLGLKALECRENVKYTKLKKKIIEAILMRQESCGGFWYQNQWTNSGKEIHLRYSAAAIRLLTEAYNDKLIEKKETVLNPLLFHLSFYDKLNNGSLWFLHDSLEHPETKFNFYSKKNVEVNRLWGSSLTNQLVLNTHLDTLVTILYALFYIHDLSDREKEILTNYTKLGLSGLKLVLTPRLKIIRYLYQYIDKFARNKHFRKYDHTKYRFKFLVTQKKTNKLFRIIYRLRPLDFYFLFIRTKLKSMSGLYIHKDGFIDRDLTIKGRPALYHLINIWDFAELAHLLRFTKIENSLVNQIDDYVQKGIEYSFSSTYNDFIKDSFEYYCVAILLCEILYIQFQRFGEITAERIKRYIFIRKNLPPSPALLGYDPAIILPQLTCEYKKLETLNINATKADVLILDINKYLIINISNSDIILPKNKLNRFKLISFLKRYHTSNDKVIIKPGAAVLLEKIK
ncbi:MAG: hypothetical protein ACFFDF_11160 [Candidatus Odinarchaeota archaeon]